jgi:hypothetical protein
MAITILVGMSTDRISKWMSLSSSASTAAPRAGVTASDGVAATNGVVAAADGAGDSGATAMSNS